MSNYIHLVKISKSKTESFSSLRVDVKKEHVEFEQYRYWITLTPQISTDIPCVKFCLLGNGCTDITDNNWLYWINETVNANDSRKFIFGVLNDWRVSPISSNLGYVSFHLCDKDEKYKNNLFLLTNIPSKYPCAGIKIKDISVSYKPETGDCYSHLPRSSYEINANVKFDGVHLFINKKTHNGEFISTEKYFIPFSRPLTVDEQMEFIYTHDFTRLNSILRMQSERENPNHLSLIDSFGVSYFQSHDKKLIIFFRENYQERLIDDVNRFILDGKLLPEEMKYKICANFNRRLIDCYLTHADGSKKFGSVSDVCFDFITKIKEIEKIYTSFDKI